MGLDMYLNRMPRCKGATAFEVDKIESYIDYVEKCNDPESDAKNYSMEEWCGVDESEVPMELLEFYKPFYTIKYSDWDEERRYGWGRIMDQVAYWRKANAIHDWFVNNVQDGEDDCQYHDEVTQADLIKLLNTCNTVLKHSKLVEGKIANGYHYNDSGEKVYNYEEGKFIEDPSVAEELLPTTEGFFFGSTDYDEWYYQDIEYTANKIVEILETTDFETQMIYYRSSW